MWPAGHAGVTHRRNLGPNKEIWVLDFFLGSVWMLQLHLCCPQSWLLALPIMSGPLLEGCPTEGKKAISTPTLPSRVCPHELWISSPLGVTPQVLNPQDSTALCGRLLAHVLLHWPSVWWASSKLLAMSQKRLITLWTSISSAHWLPKARCSPARSNRAA